MLLTNIYFYSKLIWDIISFPSKYYAKKYAKEYVDEYKKDEQKHKDKDKDKPIEFDYMTDDSYSSCKKPNYNQYY